MIKHFSIILIIALAVASCKKEDSKPVTPLKISFKKEGHLVIRNNETDSIVAEFDIEIAESEYEIQTGLMHRESMEDNQAMLFIFPNVEYRSFFMKNTLIPLDIIYFDDNGKLVSSQVNAKPLDETGLPSKAPAKYVLEINAGLTEKLDLRIGDRIEYNLE